MESFDSWFESVDNHDGVVDETGFTFEQTFDSSGTTKYFCRPHKSVGMKGVVVE